MSLYHLRELRVVHVHDVLRLPRHVGAVEVRLRVGPGAAQPQEHVVELPVDGAGDEGAVLLEPELGVDAGRLPVLDGDLHEVQEVGTIARPGRLHCRLQPVRVACLGQEALGLGRVVLVELSALRAELVDGDRPVGERRGHHGVRHPVPLGEREGLEDLGEVVGARERPPNADVVERRPVDPEAGDVADEPGVLGSLKPGLPLPGEFQVDPPHRLLILGAEVGLPAEPRGQPRGRVLVDDHLDAVGVGQPGDEVVGVPDID